MSETMWLYFPIVWVLLFPALCWLCFISIDFDKANLYLYIWLASPFLLPVILAVVIAWFPVKWTLRTMKELGVPMFKITETTVIGLRTRLSPNR
jgi:hypothetical protein